MNKRVIILDVHLMDVCKLLQAIRDVCPWGNWYDFVKIEDDVHRENRRMKEC